MRFAVLNRFPPTVNMSTNELLNERAADAELRECAAIRIDPGETPIALPAQSSEVAPELDELVLTLPTGVPFTPLSTYPM